MPLRLLLTGNPGTEDVIAAEALEEVPGSRILSERKGFGRVIVETSCDEIDLVAEALSRMRSIHHGILLLAEGRVSKGREGLGEIKEIVEGSDVHRYLSPLLSFAVRAERSGEGHEYTSVDVAREVGDSVVKVVLERTGRRPPVRLNSPSVVIHAEVIEEEFRFGIVLTGERSRHRRGYRIYDHPAALKPTLAYSMIRISGAKDGDTILDPMCGGGTIAIEAALTFPISRIICMDKSPAHIRGARMNALAARVGNRIEFLVGDARKVHELLGEGSVDVVISNPPYGIRLGDPTNVRRLYREFLPSLSRALRPGGRATIITTESDYIIRLLRTEVFRLRLTHIRKVRHGDLWASIIVLERS